MSRIESLPTAYVHKIALLALAGVPIGAMQIDTFEAALVVRWKLLTSRLGVLGMVKRATKALVKEPL